MAVRLWAMVARVAAMRTLTDAPVLTSAGPRTPTYTCAT
uniref:Uncharacterized protein n=1 Tax=uncultured bacterium esnapd26 TaxID=1366607 RepID=S5TLS5_9BACT|nr:hypothetical protein [uncultured bacterium esnapd26]